MVNILALRRGPEVIQVSAAELKAMHGLVLRSNCDATYSIEVQQHMTDETHARLFHVMMHATPVRQNLQEAW